MTRSRRRVPARPVVALLTDFGLSDPYAGQMKGVVATLAPEARILDISHGVPAHDILAGALYLDASLPWLPLGCVIVAVVDPGVGTTRRLVGVKSRGRLVLAPDNGLLSLLLSRGGVDGAWVFPTQDMGSATFHGRDIFAPLAAALAKGEPPRERGQPVDPGTLVILPGLDPVLDGDRLQARVLHVDRFGNLILNLRIGEYGAMLGAAHGVAMDMPRAPRIVRAATYAELPPGALGLLAGSQGFFEMAMDRESAARSTGLHPGDAVTLVLSGETAAGPDRIPGVVSER